MNITINGYEIVAEEGITILEAAKRADIHIPTLCYVNKGTSDIPCEICVVSVDGVETPVRSCLTPISEGMRITTESKELQAKRAERMTLLMETHFGDCKAPCNLTCPGQINVQGYIAHVAKGQYEEALRLVMERNPFPFSVGRVCPRFCETRCRRILVDEPVSINHLKRFVADWCMAHKIELRIPRDASTGKKIAVIGGGPSGLTGAYYLARKGHDVTVFESSPKLGGMLRYGIPDYKIPQDVLDYEISTILRMGINVRLSQKWGEDFTLQSLKDQGYEAILIATGTPVDERLDVPGCALPKVIPATKFLRDMSEGKTGNYGRSAVVFGGNNVAMEVARSLLRNEVGQVTIIYPRAQTEMSANQRNIRVAEKEGVQFLLMAAPVNFSDTSNGIAVQLIRTKLGEPDEKGIRYPEAIPGTTVNINADTVIVAQGLSACREKFEGGELESSLELTPKCNIKANPRTSLTNHPGIYAAGDVTSGPRSVIQAVVAARRAAENIHAQVMGITKTVAESRFNFSRGKGFDDVDLRNFEGVNIKLREKMPTRPPQIATQDFSEIKLGFSEQMAITEAKRCLSCGCRAFDRCDLKKLATDFGLDPTRTGMAPKPVYTEKINHPMIQVDLNKCIYCKRCLNSCEYDALEISADDGVDDKGRPLGLRFKFKENCVNCGACVDNCSTGALNKKDVLVPVINEPIREVRSTCPYCGAGCQIILKVKGNTLMEVTADPDLAPNYGALCVKGRFGHNFVQHKDRLTKPLVRRGSQLVETSWEDALNIVAKRFFDLKAMYGPDSISGFSCARASNEENYLMQKFMRTAIGTNNIDHCARL